MFLVLYRFVLFTLLFTIFVVYPLFIFIVFLSADKINPAISIANPFGKLFCNFPPQYHKVITFIRTHNHCGITTFLLDLEVESVVFTMTRFDKQVFKVFILFILHDITDC
jgi:hypothetical protein